LARPLSRRNEITHLFEGRLAVLTCVNHISRRFVNSLRPPNAGTGAGQNLAGVGMNVNLAPVLDVYYKSGNFIDQFQRSYSKDPTVVLQCGQAFITAQQATGVAASPTSAPDCSDTAAHVHPPGDPGHLPGRLTTPGAAGGTRFQLTSAPERSGRWPQAASARRFADCRHTEVAARRVGQNRGPPYPGVGGRHLDLSAQCHRLLRRGVGVGYGEIG